MQIALIVSAFFLGLVYFQQVDVGPVSGQQIALVWSLLWSAALEYLWFVKDWFAPLEAKKKKTVNFLGLLIVVAGAYVLSLFNVINAFTPDVAGAFDAIIALYVALGIGQGFHIGTKRT